MQHVTPYGLHSREKEHVEWYLEQLSVLPEEHFLVHLLSSPLLFTLSVLAPSLPGFSIVGDSGRVGEQIVDLIAVGGAVIGVAEGIIEVRIMQLLLLADLSLGQPHEQRWDVLRVAIEGITLAAFSLWVKQCLGPPSPVLLHGLDEAKALLWAYLVEPEVAFSDIRGNPLELYEAEAEVLVLLLVLMVDALVGVPARVVVPEAVLVSALVLDENLDECVASQGKVGHCSHALEEVALNLPILDPDLFQVYVVPPLATLILPALIGVVLGVGRPVRLRHNREHAVTEVTPPLVLLLRSNPLRQLLPEPLIVKQQFPGDLLRIVLPGFLLLFLLSLLDLLSHLFVLFEVVVSGVRCILGFHRLVVLHA